MGPLSGYRVIEIAGLGPAPFAGMLLADMGAEVIRIDRSEGVGAPDQPNRDILARGRRSVAVNLKDPAGVEAVLRLVEGADVFIEGFRPGVAERLGIGPEVCQARNPKLVYGRMTGWGQTGPRAGEAGHDIDYIALAGALAHIGRAGDAPVPPLNLVGDFGGGGMFLAFGVVCALLETQRSGQGQIVDAAMVDGVAVLMAMMWSFRAGGSWNEDLGANLLDSGAPFYDTYVTADDKFMAVGPLEPKFYVEMLERLGLDAETLPKQYDREAWPELRSVLADAFRGRTRDAWTEVFAGSDACVVPVLTMTEAATDPHLVARGTFVTEFDVLQPAPAPRFSRTPATIAGAPEHAGASTDAVLEAWGFTADEIAALRAAGAIA